MFNFHTGISGEAVHEQGMGPQTGGHDRVDREGHGRGGALAKQGEHHFALHVDTIIHLLI